MTRIRAWAPVVAFLVGALLPFRPAPEVRAHPTVMLSPDGAQRGRVVSRQKEDSPRKAKGKAGDKERGSDPMRVFSEIENAWVKENVDAILAHFGKGKVAISVAGTGPSGGEFSRSQSFYLLKDLFKYTSTDRFEFVQFRKSEDEEKTSFAVAERSYRKANDGRLFKDKIYVSLHLEDNGERPRWVIDEIKSIR